MNKILSILMDILKKGFEYLKKFGKWLIKDIKNIVIVVLALAALVSTCTINSTKKELHETQIALIESNDSTFVYKNKAKELYAATETYIADIGELKRQNSELYKEYKNLKDQPVIIERFKTVIQIDSIKVVDSILVYPEQKAYTAKFNYTDKWCTIDGATHFDTEWLTATTDINTVKFPATFTTDLVERKGDLVFLTKCDNPYVQINNIEGAVVSPEQSKTLRKRFDRPWGIMIGVGPSIGIIDNSFKVYPAVQLTLGYKLISF